MYGAKLLTEQSGSGAVAQHLSQEGSGEYLVQHWLQAFAKDGKSH